MTSENKVNEQQLTTPEYIPCSEAFTITSYTSHPDTTEEKTSVEKNESRETSSKPVDLTDIRRELQKQKLTVDVNAVYESKMFVKDASDDDEETGIDPVNDTGIDPVNDTGIDPVNDTGIDPVNDTGIEKKEKRQSDDDFDITEPRKRVKTEHVKDPTDSKEPADHKVPLNTTTNLFDLAPMFKKQCEKLRKKMEARKKIDYINVVIGASFIIECFLQFCVYRNLFPLIFLSLTGVISKMGSIPDIFMKEYIFYFIVFYAVFGLTTIISVIFDKFTFFGNFGLFGLFITTVFSKKLSDLEF